MKHFKVFLLFVSIALLTSSVFAGSEGELKKDTQDIHQSKSHFRHTIVTLNDLSMAIDLWHDANLKADHKAVAVQEQKIIDIIEYDIKESHQAVSYAKLEASYSKDEAKGDNPGTLEKKDDQHDFVDDQKDLSLLNRYINSKKHILKSLRNSKSFGYKYRILADYQELLRKELVLDKVEIAEDIDEAHEDVGSTRTIKR